MWGTLGLQTECIRTATSAAAPALLAAPFSVHVTLRTPWAHWAHATEGRFSWHARSGQSYGCMKKPKTETRWPGQLRASSGSARLGGPRPGATETLRGMDKTLRQGRAHKARGAYGPSSACIGDFRLICSARSYLWRRPWSCKQLVSSATLPCMRRGLWLDLVCDFAGASFRRAKRMRGGRVDRETWRPALAIVPQLSISCSDGLGLCCISAVYGSHIVSKPVRRRRCHRHLPSDTARDRGRASSWS